MTRTLARLVFFAAAAFLVSPARGAHADPPPDESQGDPGEEGSHLQYPVTAAVFRVHYAQRVTQARSRMEKHIVDHQLDQAKADALRARFQSALTQVNAKVDEVCSDGTVTRDEAIAVHELAKSLRHHPQK